MRPAQLTQCTESVQDRAVSSDSFEATPLNVHHPPSPRDRDETGSQNFQVLSGKTQKPLKVKQENSSLRISGLAPSLLPKLSDE